MVLHCWSYGCCLDCCICICRLFIHFSVSVTIKAYFLTAAPFSGIMLEWYYIVGPVAAVIIVAFVSWYICKRRRTSTYGTLPVDISYYLCKMFYFITFFVVKSSRVSARYTGSVEPLIVRVILDLTLIAIGEAQRQVSMPVRWGSCASGPKTQFRRI